MPWDEYVARHERGTPYHTTIWGALIQEIFGHEAHYLYALDKGGSIVGVLPSIRLKSYLFGDFLVSMPYFNYGGAIGDSESIEEALMIGVSETANERRAGHVEFRDVIARSSSWPVRTDKVAMKLELKDTPEAIFKSFSSKLRSQIRRPTKEHAQAVHGHRELLPEFYAVFARNMRDLGTPVYPKKFFAAMLRMIPDQTSICVVRMGAQPVAAAFVLRDDSEMQIPWASSIREFNRFGVNMLLYWEVIRQAIDANCKRFDFGRSSRDGGTFRFKQQWGAQPIQLYWHYWQRTEQELPGLTPSNPRFRTAVNLWKKLPITLASVRP